MPKKVKFYCIYSGTRIQGAFPHNKEGRKQALLYLEKLSKQRKEDTFRLVIK
jgi:hypothetical protein